jgi:hypothetical protein
MRRDRLLQCPMSNIQCQIDYLVAYNEVINQEVEYPIEDEVSSAARCVAEELFRHQFAERAIEKINTFNYFLT